MLLKCVIAHIVRANAPRANAANDGALKCSVVGIRRAADVLDVADETLVDLSNLNVAILCRIYFDTWLVLACIADDLAGEYRQAVDGQDWPTLDFSVVAVGRKPLVSCKKLAILTRSLAPLAPVA